MTDALMQHGQHGAEVLAGLMHGVFDPLVESVFDYGGKIIGFAGDGMMALYPVEGDAASTALHALSSAYVIQSRLGENATHATVYGTFSVSAKIGLAAGSVSWGILRSSSGDQATYYFRGSAVDEAAEAEVFVVTAGIARKPGMSRDDLVKTNAGIVRSVSEQIARVAPKSVVVVVSNPLDVMCYVAMKASRFPRERILGMVAAEDVFDAYLPLLRMEHLAGVGLAVRKALLHRRGAIASPTLRAPGASLTADDQREIERLVGRLERRLKG